MLPKLSMVKDIKIDDFDYDLPDGFIPKYPLKKRDECRLLLHAPQDLIFHRKFKELPDLLPPGSMLICNDTKVIRARLNFQKESGASIEIFLLEPILPSDYVINFQSTEKCRWKCLVGNLKKWKDSDLHRIIKVVDGRQVTLYAHKSHSLPEGGIAIDFYWDNSEVIFSTIIENAGTIPIPPYLNRESEDSDTSDYQTVYAKQQGSVAAPTAGLHFTPEIFESLKAHGVTIGKLTLHVGAGTFRPVKSPTIGQHEMHAERFTISLSLIEAILCCKKAGKKIVAVGTTSVRTLESLPHIASALQQGEPEPFHLSQWKAYDHSEKYDVIESMQFLGDWMKKKKIKELTATTAIMIAPGFKWKITDAIITNFHQPKSTLLLLVASFLEKNGDFTSWRKIYEQALKSNYRFLSYGDASLLIR